MKENQLAKDLTKSILDITRKSFTITLERDIETEIANFIKAFKPLVYEPKLKSLEDYIIEHCEESHQYCLKGNYTLEILNKGDCINILELIASDLNGEFKDDNFWIILSIGGKYYYDIIDNDQFYLGSTKFSSKEIAQLVIENYEPLLNKIYK